MEETKYIYADKSEYPEVCVQEKNRQYAAAMLGNVGACDSEMSAVSLYFYNGVIAEGKFEEISECFHKISIVEMHHLHTFATLANLLGADPRMWSVERGRYRYRMHFAGSNRPLQNTADRKNGYRIVISGKFWSGSS